MSPAVGWTRDLQRLCSARNSRLSTLLSAVGEIQESELACCAKVAKDPRFFRTTGVAAADNRMMTLMKLDISIVLHMSASGVELDANWLNKPFKQSRKLLFIISDTLIRKNCQQFCNSRMVISLGM